MTDGDDAATDPVEQDGNQSSYDPEVDPAASYARKVAPNRVFYDSVRATKSDGTRSLVYERMLEPHTGDAYFVEAGQVIRMEQRPSLHNGRTQIIDVLWVTPDLEQISDHLNTSALEGLNPWMYGGIWTQSGYCEKIATLVEDEFPYEELEHDRVAHIFFAAHCCAEWIMLAHGPDAHVNSCHQNFVHGFNRLPAVQAIADQAERRRLVQRLADRNDVNVFQANQFAQPDGRVTRCLLSPSPSVPDGTGIEWYAEKDQYVVISNCPYADQALPFPEADPNPVYVSVWDTGIQPETDDHLGVPKGWEAEVYQRLAGLDISPR